jgi:hypothetical protein
LRQFESMYTPQRKTRSTRHVRFPRQSTYARRTLPAGDACTWQHFTKSLTTMDRVTAPEKNGSRHNPQHVGWPICGSIPSFSPEPGNEAVGGGGVKPPSVGNQLLGLPDSYRRHVIGMLNTCLRGSTYRSLTDSGGGYNLGGASLPYTTLRHSQPVVSTFP